MINPAGRLYNRRFSGDETDMQMNTPFRPEKRESSLITILCIAMVAMLALSLLPMFAIAQYDLPTGDDELYGAPVRQALAGDPSLKTALLAAAGVVAEKYQSWQGTFSAIFLMALQPGVFALTAYRITPYLMLGSLIASSLYLLYTLLCTMIGLPRRIWLLIGSAALLFSIQLCISPREAFFWYNGAVYYTLYYAFSLVLIAFVLRMFHTERAGARSVYVVLGVLLCAVLSGGNYVSVMICGEFLLCAIAYAVWKKQYRLLAPLVAMLVVFGTGLAVSIAAPGNAIRQAAVLSAGYTQSGLVKTVLLSLAMGAGFALQWFDVASVALILLTAVFVGPYLQKTGWRFRFPLLAVAFAFCVFASQFAPSAFAASSPGPYRLRNIVYFSFLWMITFDAAYLTGWAQRRFDAAQAETGQIRPAKLIRSLAVYPAATLACAALLIAAPLIKTMPPAVPSVVAVAELLDGTAEKHAQNRINQTNGTTTTESNFVESKLLS